MNNIIKGVVFIFVLWLAGPFVWSFVTPYGVGFEPGDTERIHQLAIQNQDISICDKIHLKGWGDVTDGELISHCYRVYARALPQDNVCDRLLKMGDEDGTVSENDRADFTLCVAEEAIGARDADLCERLANKYLFASCVINVAMETKDSTLCETLPMEESRKTCYIGVTR